MSRISTNNLFIKSLYEDLTPAEQRQLEEASWEDQQQYSELISVKRQLKRVSKTPSQTSIDIILEYSQKTAELDPIM